MTTLRGRALKLTVVTNIISGWGLLTLAVVASLGGWGIEWVLGAAILAKLFFIHGSLMALYLRRGGRV